MKAKIVVTPALLQEMEENVRNSPSYKSKLEDAKADLLRNKEALNEMFQQIRKSKA
jgi:hypothetical protein